MGLRPDEVRNMHFDDFNAFRSGWLEMQGIEPFLPDGAEEEIKQLIEEYGSDGRGRRSSRSP